jgi:hypothetical protein
MLNLREQPSWQLVAEIVENRKMIFYICLTWKYAFENVIDVLSSKINMYKKKINHFFNESFSRKLHNVSNQRGSATSVDIMKP